MDRSRRGRASQQCDRRGASKLPRQVSAGMPEQGALPNAGRKPGGDRGLERGVQTPETAPQRRHAQSRAVRSQPASKPPGTGGTGISFDQPPDLIRHRTQPPTASPEGASFSAKRSPRIRPNPALDPSCPAALPAPDSPQSSHFKWAKNWRQLIIDLSHGPAPCRLAPQRATLHTT